MRAFLVASGVSAVMLLGSFAVGCSSSGGSSSGGNGTSGDGGPGSSGGSSGGEGGGAAGALPLTTVLYVSKATPDLDILMALDLTTGQTRVVTDLRADGSQGWSIAGYSLSPDRTRIAIASLYGPTQADVDTKLPTQTIWTFATDGSDFRRLTPTFANTGGGKKQFVLEVRNPAFKRAGDDVLFNYGEYWYEGNTLTGGSGIWSIAASGGKLPALFKAPSPCSLTDPSVDPSTGKVAIIHSVCIPGQGKDGIYLYAEDGSGTPEALLAGDATVDVALEPPRWVADGSGFVFIGTTNLMVNGSSIAVRGLYALDMATRKPVPLVLPQAKDTYVTDAAPAPDASAVVYCLREGEATNLHVIDLTKNPATDTAITNDGKSCHPVW